MDSLHQEVRNMRDSNSNHCFINNKLNAALKKATAHIQELEEEN